MTAPVAATGAPASLDASRAQLKRASHDMESLFFSQLLQAMRAALPEGGVIEHSQGEQMFTAMLDDKVASLASAHTERGLADALYRQMSARLPAEPSAPAKLEVSNAGTR